MNQFGHCCVTRELKKRGRSQGNVPTIRVGTVLVAINEQYVEGWSHPLTMNRLARTTARPGAPHTFLIYEMTFIGMLQVILLFRDPKYEKALSKTHRHNSLVKAVFKVWDIPAKCCCSLFT